MLDRCRAEGIGVVLLGIPVTSAHRAEFTPAIRAEYGAYTLEDINRAVSLEMFGPSLFVIADERLGGLELSVGYAAIAMSDEQARWLTDNAVARLEKIDLPGKSRAGAVDS